jgi:hypothetical protein
MTPAVVELGAALRLGLARWIHRGEPRLTVTVDNLLDRRPLWPAGYSALQLVRDPGLGSRVVGTAYYYPLASRSVTAVLSLAVARAR